MGMVGRGRDEKNRWERKEEKRKIRGREEERKKKEEYSIRYNV